MSTRAFIGIQNENGTIDAVYSHFDNYLESTGRILFEYINTTEDVKELISMGDISSLADMVFYARDRGEELKIHNFNSLDTFLKECQEDYTYVFIEEQWFFRQLDGSLFKLNDEVIH